MLVYLITESNGTTVKLESIWTCQVLHIFGKSVYDLVYARELLQNKAGCECEALFTLYRQACDFSCRSKLWDVSRMFLSLVWALW